MSPIIYLAAGLIVIAAIFAYRRRLRTFHPARAKSKSARVIYRRKKIPDHLGLREDIPYVDTVVRLEKNFNKYFGGTLKTRIQQEYPRMHAHEFRWKVIELKRYFIMASLLKRVPMFSDQVDQLWHEMLMYTKSYADFCADFMGATIHHEPAVTRTPSPGARAWFDWVYCQLFEFTPYSATIWGNFFSYPLSRDIQQLIQHGTHVDLVDQLFHARRMQEDPEAARVITLLIERLQGAANVKEEELAYDKNNGDLIPLVMANAMVYYSIHNEGTYGSQMSRLEKELLPHEKAPYGSSSSSGCSSSSSCYADDCRDGSDSSSGGTSSSSSSDSSCSSSSCSSCGGGGD